MSPFGSLALTTSFGYQGVLSLGEKCCVHSQFKGMLFAHLAGVGYAHLHAVQPKLEFIQAPGFSIQFNLQRNGAFDLLILSR